MGIQSPNKNKPVRLLFGALFTENLPFSRPLASSSGAQRSTAVKKSGKTRYMAKRGYICFWGFWKTSNSPHLNTLSCPELRSNTARLTYL
jgi:hypothetical protein